MNERFYFLNYESDIIKINWYNNLIYNHRFLAPIRICFDSLSSALCSSKMLISDLFADSIYYTKKTPKKQDHHKILGSYERNIYIQRMEIPINLIEILLPF